GRLRPRLRRALPEPAVRRRPERRAHSTALETRPPGRRYSCSLVPFADRGPVNRFFRSALFPLFVIVVLVYLASQTLLPHSKSAKKVTYSDFITAVSDNNVKSAEFNPSK